MKVSTKLLKERIDAKITSLTEELKQTDPQRNESGELPSTIMQRAKEYAAALDDYIVNVPLVMEQALDEFREQSDGFDPLEYALRIYQEWHDGKRYWRLQQEVPQLRWRRTGELPQPNFDRVMQPPNMRLDSRRHEQESLLGLLSNAKAQLALVEDETVSVHQAPLKHIIEEI